MEKRPVQTNPAPTETSKSSSVSSAGKATIIVLGIVAGLLAAALVFVAINRGKLVNELKMEKEDLSEQVLSLQQEFATLSSDYENINAQLDSSREEVNLLVERLQKTDATNRAKIRQYQKELGTLRGIMKGYIAQIDSLNTLNHKLSEEAAAARKDAATAKAQNVELQKTVSDLSDKVETSAVVRGRNVQAVAVNKNGKQVDRASAVSRVLVSLTLTENALAEKGPIRVYIVVRDADGNLLKNSQSTSCNYAGSKLETSASREIDYQGSEIDLSIYLNDIPSYTKGMYTVQALTERTLLGTTQFLLR